MTHCKMLKQTYMTHKTSLFEYVVRVYPIETKKGGGGGTSGAVQRQGGGGVRSVRGVVYNPVILLAFLYVPCHCFILLADSKFFPTTNKINGY